MISLGRSCIMTVIMKAVNQRYRALMCILLSISNHLLVSCRTLDQFRNFQCLQVNLMQNV